MSPKIKVDRAALEVLSKKISAEVHHAGQVGNQAVAGRMSPRALGRSTQRWVGGTSGGAGG